MSKEVVPQGDQASGLIDTGNPVKTGGVARTTNPTAVDNGDRVGASYDDVGRQITTPYQVRDLIATARASITATGEQTLLSGAAGTFRDLVQITGANESTNAVSVIIRDATGGGALLNIEIPANNTTSLHFPIPIPQNVAADAWTAQITDFVSDGTTNNGTVVITALFANNV